MENLIAVFNNRSQTMQFASYLKRIGVKCKTVDTPRELSMACGLSVMFCLKDLSLAQMLLCRNNFTAFVNIYRTDGKKYFAIY